MGDLIGAEKERTTFLLYFWSFRCVNYCKKLPKNKKCLIILSFLLQVFSKIFHIVAKLKITVIHKSFVSRNVLTWS